MMKSNQAMEVTTIDRGRLDQLESTISKNMKAFYEIGTALKEIRDSRLYKTVLGFDTFEDYCRERWDMSRIHGHRLIESAQVHENLLPTGNIQPTSERQVRPLTKLSTLLQIEAWTKSVETAPDGRVTARHISGVVNDLLDGGQKEKSKKKAQDGERIDDSFKTALKTLEKAVLAAKRDKYKTIPKEDILGNLDALKNMVALTPRTTKRQTELQQFFFQVDEDITRRAAFHVENIKIGDQMRIGDKLTTRGKILKLKGGKVLDVRVVVEKR